jgi:hypothetical protein
MLDLRRRADTSVSILSEDVARKLSRRQALSRGVKGIATAAAALSIGELVRPSIASAVNCTCSCNPPFGCLCGSSCMNKTCPQNGCPSGCTICTTADGCGGNCPYDHGFWICCTGCGSCGLGYYVCYDCKCGSDCNSGSLCGCKSNCRCSGCCSRSEVKAQMLSEMGGQLTAPV